MLFEADELDIPGELDGRGGFWLIPILIGGLSP